MTEPIAGEGAERLLDGAKAEAERMGSDVIGAEHILLRAAADPVAATAFRALGIAPEAARERLLAGVRKGRGRAEGEELVLTSHARRLVEAASAEAKRRGASEVGAEHLLLAAFRDPRGTVARLLNDGGISAGAARNAVLTAIGAETEPDVEVEVKAVSRPEPRPEREPRPPREPKPLREPREPRTPREPKGRTSDPKAGKTEPATRPTPPPKVEPRQPLPHLRRDTSDWGPIWRRVLLLAVPGAIVANYTHQSPVVIFALACLGVLPLAGFMGDATEHLSARTGPTVGGLLNATFGNAAELIIAIVALRAGLIDLVKASIAGSILGNLLLILGLSLVAGGVRTSELKFNRTSVSMSAGMMTAAVVGLVFPALFHATHPNPDALVELRLSEGVAVVLIATYLLSLLFTLRTHRWLIGGDPHDMPGPIWSVVKAVVILGIATVGVAVMSEILVHATEAVTAQVGLSEFFLGLIVIPLIGNAAEHATAIVVARKGKMDLALQIAYGSSTQIALFVGPVLVFAGLIFGQDMNFVFTPFEVMAVGLATIVATLGTADGESHWFEGVQLLAVYALIGIAAFFI
jgi:Ca2+:H+ antiporter